jgi:hypothetical protein
MILLSAINKAFSVFIDVLCLTALCAMTWNETQEKVCKSCYILQFESHVPTTVHLTDAPILAQCTGSGDNNHQKCFHNWCIWQIYGRHGRTSGLLNVLSDNKTTVFSENWRILWFVLHLRPVCGKRPSGQYLSKCTIPITRLVPTRDKCLSYTPVF